MAFTVNRVEFRNLQSYDETIHALALGSAIVDFVVDGFTVDVDNATISNGRGVNQGAIFTLGARGETKSFNTLVGTYFLILKTTLDGASNVSEIEVSTDFKDENDSTLSVKYFTLYELHTASAGEVVRIDTDYRHINYVKSLEFISVTDDSFALSINGFQSDPFDVSIVQNAYSKLESRNLFGNEVVEELDLIFDVGDVLDLSQYVARGVNPTLLGFYRIILQPNSTSHHPVVLDFFEEDGETVMVGQVSTVRMISANQQAMTTYTFHYDVSLSTFTYAGNHSQVTQIVSPYVISDSSTYSFKSFTMDKK